MNTSAMNSETYTILLSSLITDKIICVPKDCFKINFFMIYYLQMFDLFSHFTYLLIWDRRAVSRVKGGHKGKSPKAPILYNR